MNSNNSEHSDNPSLIPLLALGNLQEAQSLLDSDHVNEMDVNGWTPLCWAAFRGYNEIGSTLIKYGADVNVQTNLGQTPIILAAQNAHADAIQMLLKSGAFLNIRDQDGDTVLTTCIIKRMGTDSIGSLIEYGADVVCIAWARPLILAVCKGEIEICKLLIDSGANVDACDINGRTALIWAANNDNYDMCEMLLEKGASVDSANVHGNTALILAAANGNTDICSLLLSHHADPILKNKWRKGAVDRAKNPSVLKLLHAFIQSSQETLFMQSIWFARRNIDHETVYNTIPLHIYNAYFAKYGYLCDLEVDCPWGIVQLTFDTFIVTDVKLNRVFETDLHRILYEYEYDDFSGPEGVDVANGKLYVCNYYRSCVSVFELRGKFLFNIGDGVLKDPVDCEHAREALYVVDWAQGMVFVFKESEFVMKLGGEGKGVGNLYYPGAICMIEKYAIVSDSGNSRLQVFNVVTERCEKVIGDELGFTQPEGICIIDKTLPCPVIGVVDFKHNCIVVIGLEFVEDGVVKMVKKGEVGGLSSPVHCVFEGGCFIVAEAGGGRIAQVSSMVSAC